jgi:DNA polymerase
VIQLLFYDFEVFKYDWLVVVIDMNEKKQHVIINNPDELKVLYENNKNDIWIGFNSNHYDQYILKGILCGFDPKKINDFIIIKGNPGWKFSSLLRNVSLNNYDVMLNLDKGLKWFEGSMGNNIKESSVPFDIDRKLTEEEIAETVKYCVHDVEQTIDVFLQRKEEFNGRLGLVKLACKGKPLDLSLISKTKPQLTSIILDAHRQGDRDDEFDIDFPDTHQVKKYQNVLDWYMNPDNRCYYRHIPGKKTPEKTKLDIMIAGVPHTFAWGGVHGALEKYHGEGYFLMADVASLYPSLMIRYMLHSRNIKDPKKFEEIYHQRLELKKKKDPLQAVLKIVLNSTYGVLKDKNNDLYDPLMSNKVCIYGQILLLDLIEHLEAHCELIQSNTDGILIKMPDGMNEDEWFNTIDDIAYEWEQRTGLTLEFDEYRKVFQKDVNNYIVVAADGHYKSKGAYVKSLSNLDNGDFPIVNQALTEYMVKGTPVEYTINQCDELKQFQLVSKISGKYDCIMHGEKVLKEKCIRIFASLDESDAGVQKIHATTGRPAKLSNSPLHCFIFNDDVNGVKVPSKLNKQWYINLAEKRIEDFGVNI